MVYYLEQIEWRVSNTPVAYPEAVAWMEARVEAIHRGEAGPCIWLLEHPPLYTAGSGAQPADLLDANTLPVYATGRGGQYTYHGPGQRVAYVMLDLKQLFTPAAPDLRAYIKRLEQWVITSLAEFGIEGHVREGRVGVWVEMADDSGRMTKFSSSPSALHYPSSPLSSESKIAAIGVRVRRWVAFHGVCINVHPDLAHYSGIVPCGIREFGVTSLADLGIKTTLNEFDGVLKKHASVLLGAQ